MTECTPAVDVMRIQYKVLDDKSLNDMHKIKSDAADLYDCIDELGESRELSIAKTKLEEVVMWATKHITL